jgi:hypothetical protein
LVQVAGGVPLVAKVGHGFIQKQMVDKVAIFGGEVNGRMAAQLMQPACKVFFGEIARMSA